MNLPEKTVGRLSEYRRTLLNCLVEGKTHIYSHELAQLHNITAVQVRRDIMFIGYSSMQRKGYDIQELVNVIGKILDSQDGQNVAILGTGNLGRAVIHYFVGKRSKLIITAAFDVDKSIIGTETTGVKCYDMADLEKVVKERGISIAMITVPPEQAAKATAQAVNAGIKGILNFTSIPLNVPENVYLEEYDMITSLEKVAYFVKNSQKKPGK